MFENKKKTLNEIRSGRVNNRLDSSGYNAAYNQTKMYYSMLYIQCYVVFDKQGKTPQRSLDTKYHDYIKQRIYMQFVDGLKFIYAWDEGEQIYYVTNTCHIWSELQKKGIT